MVKPRYEETSSEVQDLLRKALLLEKKIEEAEIKKAKMCACGSGKPQASCCPDMKKAEHHMQQSFGTTPEDARFHIETGGQTYNAFYNTNQALLDSEDVTNKGASSESVNLDSTPMKNTHDTINRLVEG